MAACMLQGTRTAPRTLGSLAGLGVSERVGEQRARLAGSVWLLFPGKNLRKEGGGGVELRECRGK